MSDGGLAPPKPPALFVVAHAPSASARQAGQKTAQMHLDRLKQDYAVDTIICCNASPEELGNAARCASTIQVIPVGRARKALSVVSGLTHGIPPRFGTRVLQRLARSVTGLVRERNYQLVWLEYSQLFWLLPLVEKAAHGPLRVVLSLQDVQTELVSRKPRLERTLFGAWTRAYERRILRRAGSVTVLSGKDRQLVLALCGSAVKVDVSTPVMSDFVHRVGRRDDRVKPHSLLIWGAMNRTENYASAIWFSRNAFPAIRERFPGATLFIVGANPPRQLQAVASDHVVVTGFVDDPTPYFQLASLGVVPLTEGAGIKLKTLEMLATGIKVVATPIGAEGIPSSENLVVTDITGMTKVIIELMSERDAVVRRA